MKKIIKLTESDLTKIVKRILIENELSPNTVILSSSKFCKSGLKITYDGVEMVGNKPHVPTVMAKISSAETFKNRQEKDFEMPECVASYGKYKTLVDSGGLTGGFIETPFNYEYNKELGTFLYDKNGKEVFWVLHIFEGGEHLANYINIEKNKLKGPSK
jgi:hypothetical protein